MGAAQTKEEAAVLNLLQCILSRRGIKYEEDALKGLLQWSKEKGLFSGVGTAFEISTWEAIGIQLWDTITDGGKAAREAQKYSTLWKLIRETLRDMKSERAAAALAAEALSPVTPSVPPPEPPALPASQLPAEPPTKGSKNPDRNPFDHYTGGRTHPKTAKTVKKGFQSMPSKERSKPDIVTDPDDVEPRCEVKASTDYRPGASEYSLTSTPNRSPIDSNVSTPEEAEQPKELNDSTKELLQEVIEKLMAVTQKEGMGSFVPKGAGASPAASGLAPPSNLFNSSIQDSSSVSKRWKGVIRDAILEGSFVPQAFPVSVTPQGTNQWEAIDWKLLKKARAAVTQYGLHSQLSRQIITYILQSDLPVPHDTNQVASILLTPLQKLIFERNWQRLCDIEQAKPRQQGDPLLGVQSQMLTGSGLWAQVNRQVDFPNEVLQLSRDLALQALFSVPDGSTRFGFTSIKQGPTETFLQFIDRLHSAIEKHPHLDIPMKERLFKMLAFENASSKTKQSLATLPHGSEVADMIELANRAAQRETQKEVATFVAAAVKEALSPFLAKSKKKCYNCGKEGHIQTQCHLPRRNNIKWCKVCKINSHYTQDCRWAGNQKPSATAPCAMTTIKGFRHCITNFACMHHCIYYTEEICKQNAKSNLDCSKTRRGYCGSIPFS
uniref:CCHC-type domain-containing protein n=1 Tax=Amazona collaria TaxID=241587 RepID=A0A8B9F2B3_9PSIT